MTLTLVYDHLWQSTVFAAATGLFTLAFRRNRAGVRHGLWLAALIKFLIPLAVLIELGGRIPWHRIPPSGISAVVVAMSEPFTTLPAPALTLAAPPVAAANPLPAILATIWAIGALAIAISWFVRWRRIAAVVRAGSPVPWGYQFRRSRRRACWSPECSEWSIQCSSCRPACSSD